MKTFIRSLCLISLLLAVPRTGLATQSPESRTLVSAYFRYLLTQQIPAQAETLTAETPAALRSQVTEATTRWTGDLLERLRSSLEQELGESARQKFGDFVAAYTTAEHANDPAYLKTLVRDSGVDNPLPATYADLHRTISASWLKTDLDSGAALLSEIQTWLDVSRRNTDTPPLAAWLGRQSRMVASKPAASPTPKPDPRQNLRDAETEAGTFKNDASDSTAALDAFSLSRPDRRQKTVEEAQAGMQQIAMERDTAERDLAARKTAAAQTEAEAIKRQADKLAAVETEALEQRKNSWGNKLKGVLSATVGAATGAFSGGIGTEAGSRLANAIFDHH